MEQCSQKFIKAFLLRKFMVKKKSVKKEEVVETKESSKSKMKVNYWMIASVVLAVLLLINGLVAMTSGISAKTAEKKFIEFAQSQGADVEVVSVKNVGDLYEITFDFQGQEGQFHISKDGKYLGQMSEIEPKKTTQTTTTQTQQPSAYSTEDQAKLLEFNTCLAQKGVKVYGADWCGWTKKWVETLGGQQAISPIYVECTTNEALCSSEGVTGYPTTKINGQAYNGARTIEAIAQATGCSAPQLTGTVAAYTVEASC